MARMAEVLGVGRQEARRSVRMEIAYQIYCEELLKSRKGPTRRKELARRQEYQGTRKFDEGIQVTDGYMNLYAWNGFYFTIGRWK